MASDLGLHCLPMALYECPGKNGLGFKSIMTKWQNGADPDQTAHDEQSDQGLHCLLTHFCLNDLCHTVTAVNGNFLSMSRLKDVFVKKAC